MAIHAVYDVICSERRAIMKHDAFAQFECPFGGIRIGLDGLGQFPSCGQIVVVLNQAVVSGPAARVVDGRGKQWRIELIIGAMQVRRHPYGPAFLGRVSHCFFAGKQQVLRCHQRNTGYRHQLEHITTAETAFDGLFNQSLLVRRQIRKFHLVRFELGFEFIFHIA